MHHCNYIIIEIVPNHIATITNITGTSAARVNVHYLMASLQDCIDEDDKSYNIQVGAIALIPREDMVDLC